MKNVIIVDDEKMVRELFTFYLSTASDKYRLIGGISNAANAIVLCVKYSVDLILMDICTSDHESGIEATAEIKRKFPNTKIIIVTSAPDYRFITMAREAGADSFWYKEVSNEELIDVTDRTMAGESIYPDTTPEVKVGFAKSIEFTNKELEVLYYVVKGKSLTEVAVIMGVEYRTTRDHIQHLKDKTGAKTLSELAVLAARAQIVLPEY